MMLASKQMVPGVKAAILMKYGDRCFYRKTKYHGTLKTMKKFQPPQVKTKKSAKSVSVGKLLLIPVITKFFAS